MQLLQVRLGGHVARAQRDDLAAAGRVVRLGGIVQDFGAAAGDVDPRAVGREGLGGHESDAGATAGHEADVVLDGEELGSCELMSSSHSFCNLRMR